MMFVISIWLQGWKFKWYKIWYASVNIYYQLNDNFQMGCCFIQRKHRSWLHISPNRGWLLHQLQWIRIIQYILLTNNIIIKAEATSYWKKLFSHYMLLMWERSHTSSSGLISRTARSRSFVPSNTITQFGRQSWFSSDKLGIINEGQKGGDNKREYLAD